MPDSPPTCAGLEKRTGEIERKREGEERESGGRREQRGEVERMILLDEIK